MLRKCQRGHSEEGHVCLQISEPACAEKEFHACKQMQITASHYLENFLASHYATPNPGQTENQFNNFKTSLQHLCPNKKSSKQQPARFIQSQITSLLITCCRVFSAEWVPRQRQPECHSPVKPCCPGKLHLLPEI